jgi:hypothetical protein
MRNNQSYEGRKREVIQIYLISDWTEVNQRVFDIDLIQKLGCCSPE